MSDDYPGIYQWNTRPEPKSVEIWNWNPRSPSGQKCGVMSVGQSEKMYGLWSDVDCSASTYYAVCEKEPEPL